MRERAAASAGADDNDVVVLGRHGVPSWFRRRRSGMSTQWRGRFRPPSPGTTRSLRRSRAACVMVLSQFTGLAGTAIASSLVRQVARTFHGEAGAGHAPAAAAPSPPCHTGPDRAHRCVVEGLYG